MSKKEPYTYKTVCPNCNHKSELKSEFILRDGDLDNIEQKCQQCNAIFNLEDYLDNPISLDEFDY